MQPARPRTLIATTFSLLIVAGFLVMAVAAAPWAASGGNERRNNAVAEGGPYSMTYAWVFTRTVSEAISVDGKVYVAGADRPLASADDTSGGLSLYALSDVTGAILWERLLYAAADVPTPRTHILGTPTYYDGKIYFLDPAANLWALSATDGSQLWKTKVGHQSYAGRSSPLASSGRVIVSIDNDPAAGIGDQELVALDANNGGQLWRVDQGMNGGPNLVSDGTRVLVVMGANIVARNMADGMLTWQWSPFQGGATGEPIVSNNLVHVVSQNLQGNAYQSVIYALNPTNGAVVWSRSIGGGQPDAFQGQAETVFAPAAEGNNLIVATRGYVHNLRASDGQIQWTRSLEGTLQGSPILGLDKVLVARSQKWFPVAGDRMQGAALFSLRLENGETQWTTPAEEPLTVDYSSTNFLYANQRIIGAFRHESNYQIPASRGLFALGEDKLAPTWPANAFFQADNLGNGQVRLRWSPANDLNMKRFDVFKSPQPNEGFTFVGSTAWTGKASTVVQSTDPGLQVTDPRTPSNTWHYRLIATDAAGLQSVPLTTSVTVTDGYTPTPTTHGPSPPPTSPSAVPTATPGPTSTPYQALGEPALAPCGAAPLTTSNTWVPRITSPADDALMSGIVTIQGRTERADGTTSSPTQIQTSVHLRFGNHETLTSGAGTGDWSVTFDTRNMQDGDVRIWAEARGGEQDQRSNTVCARIDNGKAMRFSEFANWVEPDPATPGSQGGLRVWLRGESTYKHDVAEFAHFIDNAQVGVVRVTVQDHGDIGNNGRHDFFVGDWYDYPLPTAAGTHTHHVEVTFNPGSATNYRVVMPAYTFEVGNVPTPSTQPPHSTPTTGASPRETTPPGTEFRIEAGAIALDASLPARGQQVTVYARAINTGAGFATGRAAIAIVTPGEHAVEYAARIPVRLEPKDEDLVSFQWTPKQEGLYQIFAVIENDDQLTTADAAQRLEHNTNRQFAVGPAPVDRPVLVLTPARLNVGSIDEGTSRMIEVEVTAHGQDADAVRLDVFDDAGLELLSRTPPTMVRAGTTVRFSLQISVPDGSVGSTPSEHRIMVRAANDASSSNVQSMDVIAEPVEFRGLPSFGLASAIAAVAVAGGAGAYFRRRD